MALEHGAVSARVSASTSETLHPSSPSRTAPRGRGAETSSEPGEPPDQEHPGPDDAGADGSRDALTGRCETFDGDGRPHDRHRAKVHHPDDQEDCHQTETALTAVEAEAHTVSPGRAGVGR